MSGGGILAASQAQANTIQATTTATDVDVQTVIADVAVPATDSTANVINRDVIGSKADTAVATGTAANATLSLTAYIKAAWNLIRGVPATDSANNVTPFDVIGSKADTPPGAGTAANATLSHSAYLKALWNLLRGGTFSNLDTLVSSRSSPSLGNDEGGFFTPVTSTTQGVFGSWVQIVASTAHTVRIIELSNRSSTSGHYARIAFSTGTAGQEAANIKKIFRVNMDGWFMSCALDESLIPKGARVSVAVSNEQTASGDTYNLAVNLVEKND